MSESDESTRAALIAEGRRILQLLRDDTRRRWHRDLPIDELIDDRWERARRLGFGENSSVYHSSYIYGDVVVGQNTWIGPFTVLEGGGGLSIGSHCSISAGVQIYTHDSIRWALSGGAAEYERAPVNIGNCCHIGANVVILKGVSIGDHSVIGAGSFVNRNIPPYTVAFGTPCRPAGSVRIADDGRITLDIGGRA